jgi:hypothetical protein
VGAAAAADICMYSRCPRQYWLARVMEVPPEPTGYHAQEAALTDTILGITRGEFTELEAALGSYEMNLTKRLIGVDMKRVTRQATPASLSKSGRHWLSQFWVLERPNIKAEHSGAQCKATFDFQRAGEWEIRANVQIVERAHLGWIRTANRETPIRQLWHHSYYRLAGIVANCYNAYVLVCARSTGRIVLRRWTISAGGRAEALFKADHALEGMMMEHYPPCDSESGWCNPYECKWWRACRKEHAPKEQR